LGAVFLAAFCAHDVTLVCALFDLFADPSPIVGLCIVFLNLSLEAKAQGGVVDLHASEHSDFAIYIGSLSRRLGPLDADEILVVERTQTVEACLEVSYRYFYFIFYYHRIPI
jgi:hypothetical protein